MSLSQEIKELREEVEKKRSAVTSYTAALIELENKLKNLTKIENLLKNTPGDLPKGFTITYDNRRGYAEFTPYWRLYLRNKKGDLIAEWYAAMQRSTQKRKPRFFYGIKHGRFSVWLTQ